MLNKKKGQQQQVKLSKKLFYFKVHVFVVDEGRLNRFRWEEVAGKQ